MKDETDSGRFEGDQAEWIKEPIRVVHDDILVAKLRPRQAIKPECHCAAAVARFSSTAASAAASKSCRIS